jgi:epidermal growth factor receptor substrate 15
VFFLSLLSFGQSQEDLKEEADKLFENENYKEAHAIYVKLLAMDARSFEYNFRYGACVLLLSNNKSDAFKHLKYAITSPTINAESYYYLGKAYHLNYQFQEAIKHYKLYLSKVGDKPNEKLDANRQIQMCENGKKLITTITELVILEKKEIEISKFFRLYDLQNIGGDLLVTMDFQSKIDKKKGHIPLVHFPTNPRIIYYSSYGDKDDNGLDIYVRRRLPNGTWGLPQSISGGVNTPYDENYPYMHPSGKYLYFSSKGHNSMGGYDIFRSTFDPETNMYGPAENMDFAVSSPDDDVFYVVDSLNKYAYFGSMRQSEAGKVFVYKTLVDRVPTQFSVAKGEFMSTVDPSVKKLYLDIKDYSSGQSIGNFNSNGEGVYIATFPKGGKYEYTMRVEGRTEEYKIVVSIPFQKEFRPLKQKIVHEFTENREETIRIVNLFNEDVEGASELLALVIKKQSELAPNSQDFDLKAIEAKKIDERVLSDLGLEKYSLVEIEELLKKQVEKAENKENEIDKLENNLYAQIIENTKEIKEIDKKIESLINQVATESSNRIKLDKLLEVEQLIQQQKDLKEESNSSLKFADSLSKMKKTSNGVSSKDLLALKTAYSKLVVEDKEQEALDLLAKNKKLLKESLDTPKQTMLEDLVQKNRTLQKEIDKISDKRRDFESNVRDLKKTISDLEASMETAKNKDKVSIESKIESAKNDLTFIEEEINYLQPQLEKLLADKKVVDIQIESMQKANGISGVEASKSDAQNAIASVQTSKNIQLLSDIQSQMVIIKKDIQSETGQVASTASSNAKFENEKANYKSNLSRIESDNSLSEIEKKRNVIKQQEAFIQSINKELADLDMGLKANPTDESLKTRKNELINQKEEIETQKELKETELAQIETVASEGTKTAVSNPSQNSNNSNFEEAKLSFDTKINQIESDNSLSDIEKKQKVIKQHDAFIQSIKEELANLDDVLKVNPSDETSKKRKTELLNHKKELESQKGIKEAEIAQLETVASEETKSSVNHASQNPNGSEGQKTASSNSSDNTKDSSENITKNSSEKGNGKETETSNLNPESGELTTKSIVEDVMPNFLNRREQLEFDPSVNDDVRPILLANMNKQLIEKLDLEKVRLEKELVTNPGDEGIKSRLAALEQAKSEVKSGEFPSKEVLVENSKVNPANVGVENTTSATDTKKPVISEETVLQEIEPTYTSNLADIENNNSLTKKEKLTQKVAAQESILAKLDTEKRALKQTISTNPEDNSSMQKLAIVNKMASQIEADYISNYDQLTSLEGVEEPKHETVTKESLIQELYPNYNENKSAISSNSDLSEVDKLKKLQEEDELMLKSVDKALTQVNKELSKKETEEGKLKKTELESIQNTLESEMSERQQEIDAHQTVSVKEITQDDKDRLVSEISPSYKSDIETINNTDQSEIERYKAENKLNEGLKLSLEKELVKLDKKLKKDSDNESLISEKSTVELVLEETKQRIATNEAQVQLLETTASQNVPEEESKNETPVFRNEILGEKEQFVTETFTTKEQLEEQKGVLENYESQLNSKLTDTPLEPEETKGIQDEIEIVQQKLKTVIEQLDGISNEPFVSKEGTEFKGTKREQLSQKEVSIQKQLENQTLTKKERGELEQELTIVQNERIEIEYEELVEAREKQEVIHSKLEEKLNAVVASTPDQSLPIQRALLSAGRIDSEITSLEKNLEKSKSKEEKNNILLEIQKHELAYESILNEALVENEIRSKSASEVLTLYSPTELEQKRRKFTVSIGDLEYKIEQLDKEIAQLKPSKAKSLMSERASLVSEKELMEKELALVMKQLEAYEPIAKTIDEKAVDEPISYKEERELALSKNYKAFELVASDALKTEQDLKFIDKSLIEKRSEAKAMITKSVLVDQNTNSNEIDEALGQVKGLEAKQKELQEELAEKQETLRDMKESLPKAIKMENMVIRGVESQDLLAVGIPKTANLPVKGIEIINDGQGKYNENNPIPVDVENPSGLVYRVQVGAFSKPIPQDLFKEFVPVSGEKLNNGITRYMAGFFNSSSSVSNAKDKIRDLGYSDAFVVAYCDGKRISFSEAKELEASGKCVPKGVNELSIEVAQNTAKKMEMVDSTNLVLPEIDELSYNVAPGAAKAIPVESRLGLFFTVQVGVYNGPVNESELKYIKPLVTKRLPNGQVRYSSGMFNSISEAKPKRAEAILRGVSDAFITAYYKGERITLSEAQEIIANEGEQVIEQISPEEKTIEQNPIINTKKEIDFEAASTSDKVNKSKNNLKVQLISQKEFRNFPREELNRYNHYGNFYYDIHEYKIKSVIFESVNQLPNMSSLGNDFDTLEISSNFLNDKYAYELKLEIQKDQLSGAFGEWLLRSGYAHTISVIESKVTMRFFTNTLIEQVSLKEQLVEFGINVSEVEKVLDGF